MPSFAVVESSIEMIHHAAVTRRRNQMRDNRINGTPQGLQIAMRAAIISARALIEAATHAGDAAACRIATGPLAAGAEWLDARGFPIDG